MAKCKTTSRTRQPTNPEGKTVDLHTQGDLSVEHMCGVESLGKLTNRRPNQDFHRWR